MWFDSAQNQSDGNKMGKSEKEAQLIPLTHIHDHSLLWFGTCTWIKTGGVKLVVWASLLI